MDNFSPSGVFIPVVRPFFQYRLDAGIEVRFYSPISSPIFEKQSFFETLRREFDRKPPKFCTPGPCYNNTDPLDSLLRFERVFNKRRNSISNRSAFSRLQPARPLERRRCIHRRWVRSFFRSLKREVNIQTRDLVFQSIARVVR